MTMHTLPFGRAPVAMVGVDMATVLARQLSRYSRSATTPRLRLTQVRKYTDE